MLMARLDADHMQLVATVARQIWLRRNVVIFCGGILDPTSLIRRATEQVDPCNKVGQRSAVSDMIPRSSPITVWEKPCQGLVKINWDTALDLHQNRTGIGVIVRNHEGMLVVMFCAVKGNVSESTMADTFGSWKDVELSAQLGLRSFTLEGYALIIV
jgi:hypothetical protein